MGRRRELRPSDNEVYVQRIGKTGAQIGADHRVSTIGAEGDTTRETFSAPGSRRTR